MAMLNNIWLTDGPEHEGTAGVRRARRRHRADICKREIKREIAPHTESRKWPRPIVFE